MFRVIPHLTILIALALPCASLADEFSIDHQVFQPRPIQLGTSGGNANSRSRRLCCSGTLGALVQDGAKQYILSSNHLLARGNKARLGEDIVQPGLVDNACLQDENDVVADLSAINRLSFRRRVPNTIDAAIAEVRPGAVDPGGSILGIGQVSTATVAPQLGMPVKKSARTTGLTQGNVAAVNVTLIVRYPKRCKSRGGVARFVNQILILPGTFAAAGDSGALIVEDVPSCPRPVGLLFAGSPIVTIANPIDDVLNTLGVGPVGCPVPVTPADGQPQQTAEAPVPPPAEIPAATANGEALAGAPAVSLAAAAKKRHEESLLIRKDVAGTGIGLSDVTPGQPVIEVYVERYTKKLRRTLPRQLDGIPVKVVETGPIVAY